MRRGTGEDEAHASTPRPLRQTLEASLSEAEIWCVLTEALLCLDEPGLARLSEGLDEDTATVVKRALESLRSPSPPPAEEMDPASLASKAKVRQEWADAWTQWHHCIWESGDEDGRYMHQDNDWEAPYFDEYALAEDLEQAASALLELLPRVVDNDLEPELNLTTELLESLDEVATGLPEWIAEPGRRGLLRRSATLAVLQWEWRTRLRDRRSDPAMSAFEILDRLRRMEATSSSWALDHEALLEFVRDLDEPSQTALLAGLEQHSDAPHWSGPLTSADCAWFDAYLELTQRWSPEKHLEVCEVAIRSNWRLAIPVVEDLVAHKAFEQAGHVADLALRTLLRLDDNQRWSPLDGLLVAHTRFRYSRREDEVPCLLRLASACARGAGDLERHHAAELQAVAYEHWEDWDAMLEAFGKVTSAAFESVADGLFGAWRRLVTQRSEASGSGGPHPLEWSWVPLLVDAARLGPDGALPIRQQLGVWLRDPAVSPQHFQRLRSSLGLLTLDLGSGGALQHAAPTLQELLGSRLAGSDPLRDSRRRWLERLGARRLLPEALSVWREQAERLPPDPKDNDKSRYDPHAAWLAVVRELDESAFQRLVGRWRREHPRRRNLWQAIAARKLPVG